MRYLRLLAVPVVMAGLASCASAPTPPAAAPPDGWAVRIAVTDPGGVTTTDGGDGRWRWGPGMVDDRSAPAAPQLQRRLAAMLVDAADAQAQQARDSGATGTWTLVAEVVDDSRPDPVTVVRETRVVDVGVVAAAPATAELLAPRPPAAIVTTAPTRTITTTRTYRMQVVVVDPSGTPVTARSGGSATLAWASPHTEAEVLAELAARLRADVVPRVIKRARAAGGYTTPGVWRVRVTVVNTTTGSPVASGTGSWRVKATAVRTAPKPAAHPGPTRVAG